MYWIISIRSDDPIISIKHEFGGFPVLKVLEQRQMLLVKMLVAVKKHVYTGPLPPQPIQCPYVRYVRQDNRTGWPDRAGDKGFGALFGDVDFLKALFKEWCEGYLLSGCVQGMGVGNLVVDQGFAESIDTFGVVVCGVIAKNSFECAVDIHLRYHFECIFFVFFLELKKLKYQKKKKMISLRKIKKLLKDYDAPVLVRREFNNLLKKHEYRNAQLGVGVLTGGGLGTGFKKLE